MKLTFLGAAGEVTGSCYLVETGKTRFLIDCGMFQGGRAAEVRNFARFAFNPASLDFVLLSHAHIDHSGLLPRLVASGFGGAIYATPATCELLEVMLPDSAHLQEKETRHAARGRGAGRAPLYTMEDAYACLKRLVPVAYQATAHPASDVSCTFRDAGHILGSAILDIGLRVQPREIRLVFSGDLGQPGHAIVRDPAALETADVLLVESTYGDRLHKNRAQTLDEFSFALADTLVSRHGNVVIPSFAVGRTQDLLILMGELFRQGRLPAMDIYVDSPMALAATRITLNHPELYDQEAHDLHAWLKEGRKGGAKGPRIHFTERLEESMSIDAVRSGAVILSASGMCDGGRIRRHLQNNLPREECAVVFVGFQAAGSLGRRIVEGARSVRIFGEICPVRAKVFTIGGLSAHADQHALLDWLSKFRSAPRQCWVVHGEPLAAQGLRQEIVRRYGWRTQVPVLRQSTEL